MIAAIRILTFLTALAVAPAASAHAHLRQATPAAGSTVHGSPARVEVTFSAQLEPTFSSLKVMDRDGKQVDKMDKAVDEKDHAIIRVSLPALAPGAYRVLWKAVSVDTHTTEGEFTFEVAP